MPGPIWVASGTSGGSARRGIPEERSMPGRFVVWALGRELRLWNQRRAARARNRFVECAGLLQAGGELAEIGAKGGRQLWRVPAQLPRGIDKGAGPQHAFADCVGIDWFAGWGGSWRFGNRQGGSLFG